MRIPAPRLASRVASESGPDRCHVKLDHSGALELGAATNVALLPGEQLGIVTLTNGSPLGVPEAINNAFFDAAQHGKPTVDWLAYYENAFRQAFEVPPSGADFTKPPAQSQPAHADTADTGTYANSYYGPLTVASANGALSMTIGPTARQTTFALTHYDGDTFSCATIGENATGLSGATFTVGADGQASSVKLDFYDWTGLGTFTRD
jgi:Domain of unknown function (DUF3471)